MGAPGRLLLAALMAYGVWGHHHHKEFDKDGDGPLIMLCSIIFGKWAPCCRNRAEEKGTQTLSVFPDKRRNA